jgi:uncharacterized protein YcfJ
MPACTFHRHLLLSRLLSSGVLLTQCATAAEVEISRVVSVTASVHYGWADVLRVNPVYAALQAEQHHEECVDQPVAVQGSGAGGAVLGAVVGGVLGHTIGKGDGRTAATVAGAVAGGAIGGAAARRRGYETTATDCHDVATIDERRRLLGYDVEYRYRGEVYATRLAYDPGVRVRVRVDVTPMG